MTRMAIVILVAALSVASPAAQDLERVFKAAVNTEMVDGDVKGAIEQYKKVAAGGNRALAAQALLRMAEAYQKLGDTAEAQSTYARLVRDFADTREGAAARTRLRNESAPAPAITLRKVLDGAIEVAVSPDGRYLAHHNMMLANELWIRELASGAERVLDKAPFVSEQRFSKDGRRIAYGTCDTGEPRKCEVRVIDVQPVGTAPRRVYTSDSFVGPMDWSPDGKRLAVYVQRRADQVLQLALLDLSSGSLHVLQSVSWGGILGGVFSPDGRTLAFTTPVEDDNGANDVFLMDLQKNQRVTLVSGPSNDRPLGWTPDGLHLLFASNRNGSDGVWAQAVVDGKPSAAPRLIKGAVGSRVGAGSMTAGGALYFGSRTTSTDVEVAAIDLRMGTQVGAASRPIRSAADRKGGPSWSPDGRALAYVGARDGEPIVGVRELASGLERQFRLGSTLERFFPPTWTPDGAALVSWGRDLKGRYGVFRVSAADGTVTPVFFRDPPAVSGFAWSADGSKMYYRQGVIGTIFEREGDVERVVLPGNATARTTWTPTNVPEYWNGPMAASPDRRWLALFRTGDRANAGALIVMPLAGGTPRELLQVQVGGVDSNQAQITDVVPIWTPDSRALLVVSVLSPERSELLLIPVDGTPARKLDIKVPGIIPQLSPDGRQLAYTVGDDRPEIWVLEHFLSTLNASR